MIKLLPSKPTFKAKVVVTCKDHNKNPKLVEFLTKTMEVNALCEGGRVSIETDDDGKYYKVKRFLKDSRALGHLEMLYSEYRFTPASAN